MKKTIKIIDLLVKIANGKEVPKKIKYKGTIYTFDSSYNDNWKYSVTINGEAIGLLDHFCYYKLKDEVEIIEEDKKIEKIGSLLYCETTVESILHRKIDEIIDAINELKKGE